MPLERIDSYFNGAVESYDERLKRSAEDEDGYIRRTAEFFPKKEHLHILDIGIGTGTGLTAILEQNPTIYVDGIDCADKMLSEIPKNLPEHKERIRTICGDFFKYELEPESYDGAVSMMALHYYSTGSNKKWGVESTYGGKMTENIVQAIARDCLAETLKRIEDKGLHVVFHVHDEVIIDAPEETTVDEICGLMAAPIPWAPGLILNGAGFEGQYYMKD